ncbi:MAG: mismatch binding protein MutS2 family, partial [Pseudomonadota bacterium]
KDSLIGIDEIELGTDSDEAAALFSVALLELAKKGHYIIATTHHKRLAALLANSSFVKLIAALYDEKEQKPKFEFLAGTIGKSYAFETAQRYGMPAFVINMAKEEYGEDQVKLSELIEQSVSLQASMKQKAEEVAKMQHSLLHQKDELEIMQISHEEEFFKLKAKLEYAYGKALDEAKEAARQTAQDAIHKGMNHANIEIVKARTIKIETKRESAVLQIGTFIKWRNRSYQIASLDDKYVVLDDNGKRLKALKAQLEKEAIITTIKKTKPKETKIALARPEVCSPTLDLHGFYIEEALETLDKYLSDVALSGFSEVQVLHGVGSGKLAGAVKAFLAAHPVVKRMEDASLNRGGAGASIVWL